MNARVTGLQRSNGGVPKLPVTTAEVTAAGLVGDRQHNLKFHGGPDRAVCLLAQEIIDDLAAQGHPIRPGSTGENITIAGLDWSTLVPGVRLTLASSVVLEITSYTAPCRKIAHSFRGGVIACLDQQKNPGRARLYARVQTPGSVRVGDQVTIT
ncbi:MAG: MOSC domain-containing protein [Planctomycetes bacterium]|nr:MOSC domain-containing protein [Planctomycetota bacterium]